MACISIFVPVVTSAPKSHRNGMHYTKHGEPEPFIMSVSSPSFFSRGRHYFYLPRLFAVELPLHHSLEWRTACVLLVRYVENCFPLVKFLNLKNYTLMKVSWPVNGWIWILPGCKAWAKSHYIWLTMELPLLLAFWVSSILEWKWSWSGNGVSKHEEMKISFITKVLSVLRCSKHSFWWNFIRTLKNRKTLGN